MVKCPGASDCWCHEARADSVVTCVVHRARFEVQLGAEVLENGLIVNFFVTQVVQDCLLVCLAVQFFFIASRSGILTEIHDEIEILPKEALERVVCQREVLSDRNVGTEPLSIDKLSLERKWIVVPGAINGIVIVSARDCAEKLDFHSRVCVKPLEGIELRYHIGRVICWVALEVHKRHEGGAVKLNALIVSGTAVP